MNKKLSIINKRVSKMNKRGGEKLLSIWWFFVLAVIAVGIVSSVWIFYSREINIKQTESQVLVERIRDCLYNKNFLAENVIGSNIDLSKDCGISKYAIDSGKFYIHISFSDLNNKQIGQEIFLGNKEFEKDCVIEKAITAKKFPICFSRKVIYYKPDGSAINANILAGSNNEGGNANA